MRNIIIKISEIADGAEASVHPRSFYHGVGGSCYRSRPPAGTQHARGATSHGQSPLKTLKCQKRPTGMPGPRVCRDLYKQRRFNCFLLLKKQTFFLFLFL